MLKIFITGATGFAGSHLVEHFLTKNVTIYGTFLFESSLQNISHVKNKITLIHLDLLDKKKVEETINDIKPDQIFHLAAMSDTGDSFDNAEEFITNNVISQIHLLDSVRKSGLEKTKILIVSSADMYGIVKKEDLPIDEETVFMPTNPYAVSKITQDFMGLQYFLSYKMNIIRARPFNHIGPRQSPQFAVSSFAKKIAEAEKRQEDFITVGNLEPKRDFTNVQDIAKAYDLLMQKGKVGEVYNIGSGVSFSMKEILEKLLSMSTKKIQVKRDDSLYRPVDSLERVCDNRKIKNVTGWKPTIPLETSLKNTLDYWRAMV